MSGHDLEKLNEHPTRISAPLVKAPPSSPKFEISAPDANSRIYDTQPGAGRVVLKPA